MSFWLASSKMFSRGSSRFVESLSSLDDDASDDVNVDSSSLFVSTEIASFDDFRIEVERDVA